MAIPDKFLWGGSISAAQCEGGWDEGGKSPVQVDFGDPGSTTDRRWIHYLNADGTRGKMMLVLIFIIVIKKILRYLQNLVLQHLIQLFHGREFILME